MSQFPGHIITFHSETPSGWCLCTQLHPWLLLISSWAEILGDHYDHTATVKSPWNPELSVWMLCMSQGHPLHLGWALPLQRNSRVHQLWTWCDPTVHPCRAQHILVLWKYQTHGPRALCIHQNRGWGLSGNHKGHSDIFTYSPRCV